MNVRLAVVAALVTLAGCAAEGGGGGGGGALSCERRDSCSEYPGSYWTADNVRDMCESSAGGFHRGGCAVDEPVGTCTWWADDDPEREIVTLYDASYSMDPEDHCDAVDGLWEPL